MLFHYSASNPNYLSTFRILYLPVLSGPVLYQYL